jgi:tRNA (cmo5U34)-methyltransferase
MNTPEDSQDTVYRKRRDHLVDFAFDENVAGVFPDMIRRSVPGYETVIPISGLIAARYAKAGHACYDLGCSLGATTLALLRQLGDVDCEIIAVDNSEAMLARARRERQWDERVRFVLADLQEVPVINAGVVVINYALQFIAPEERLSTLSRIRRGIVPGGALILSEKLAGGVEFDAIHADFKKANGYSEMEVSQKRTALENVLIPDTQETHLERLRQAGFNQVHTWFKCLNWASFLAIA